MVRDNADADDVLDLSGLDQRPAELPELPAIIGTHAHFPDDPAQYAEALLDIGPGRPLLAVRRFDTVRIGVFELVLVAGEQSLRRIGFGHALAPHRDHLIVG